MSSRALRDILAKKQQEEEKERDGNGEEECEEEEENRKKTASPRRNAFDLLGDDDDDAIDAQKDDHDDYEEEDEEEDDEKQRKGKKKTNLSKNQKKKKKKRAKKDDVEKEESVAGNDVDADDGTKKNVKRDSVDGGDEGDDISELNDGRVFSIQSRFFDPDQEMRAMFGARALAESGLAKSASDRWPPNCVVRGKPGWAAGAKTSGLRMRRIEGERFEFEWSPKYSEVQELYERAVQSLQVQELADLLHMHPWHADTLFQLALVRLQLGEKEVAEELLARCLFTMQTAFHHMFSTRGDCRLLYTDHQQNRTFLMALFRYAAILNGRGCARAALEAAKFLYTLDPSDPLGALLVIDHYAVKSAQYDVLKTIAALPAFSSSELKHDEGEKEDGHEDPEQNQKNIVTTSLAPRQLPNIRYNTALAHFRMETTSGITEATGKGHERSGELLEDAISLFPLAARLLLEKDDKNERCRFLLQRKLFDETAVAETPEALAHIITIFVERNNELWHEPDVHEWFLLHCEKVASFEEKGDEESNTLKERRLGFYRTCTESGVLAGVYRHLLISDFSSVVAQLPRDAVMDVLAGDGGNFQAFDHQERPVVRAPTNNILRLLIYTLLPWVPVPNAPADE